MLFSASFWLLRSHSRFQLKKSVLDPLLRRPEQKGDNGKGQEEGRSRRTHWKACGESFQHGIENTKTVAKKQYKIKYPARGYEGWDFCDTSLNFLLDHIYTRHSQATDKDPVVTLSRMMLAVIKFI